MLEFTVDSIRYENNLDNIERIVKVHSILVLLKKASGNKLKEINVLTLLKNSRIFLTRFMRINKEVLNLKFETNSARVLRILDQLHGSVNYLRDICQSRISVSVTRQSPVYVRCVEAFVLSVKELLYVNNCDQAFKMKNLVEFDVPKQAKKTKKPAGKKKGKNQEVVEDEEEEEQEEQEVQDEDVEDVEDESEQEEGSNNQDENDENDDQNEDE